MTVAKESGPCGVNKSIDDVGTQQTTNTQPDDLMFASSLPSITPRDAHTLWYTPLSGYSTSSAFDSQPQDTPSTLSQNAQPYQGLHSSRRANHRNNHLLQLQLDEELVAMRKVAIQRFGAAWIRPPGISKTYQMMTDEQAEREEAEAQAAREAQMMQGVEETEFDPAEEEDGVEQDLDDQIPEAEELVVDDELDEEDLAEEDEGMDERDLDDDVPEAGSYQHTDTEQSDDDEDSEDTRDLDTSADMGAAPQGGMAHRSSIVRSDGSQVISEGSAGIPRVDAAQRRGRGSDRMSVDRREN
ncbi:hypothetical protein GP486_000988 [Trichoglossum hirsutum]|uniref:Apc15p protein-domain-containing protein n=1 Tax=Trichoglossum hirsutum TaxID=265104 RepID=A0A9P8LGT6_9PEZI|nr:hypothetical protein GP486_000988 [Trichoglossum hirsutum]